MVPSYVEANIAVNLQQHMASLNRAIRLMQTGPTEAGGAELLPGPGKIEFRDVRFGYTASREVLCGLSFTAQARSAQRARKKNFCRKRAGHLRWSEGISLPSGARTRASQEKGKSPLSFYLIGQELSD